MDISNNKPCLVETSQGFSVSYNNKFLYSKYNPAKAIQNYIQNLEILPGSIFLCFSPVLNYGIKDLLEKLKENCLIITVELEKNLKEFSKETICNHPELNVESDSIIELTEDEIFNLPVILHKKKYITNQNKIFPSAGTFRRIIPLEMSSGTQFCKDIYNQLSQACTNSIMSFWANRITLTKFGRRYSKNYFTNLKILSKTCPISSFISKINKPIIVFGAGESFLDGINFIKNYPNQYYILCVDTALQPLIKHGLIPDGVFIEEAQFVISKAFIGSLKYNFQIFSGLSALPEINQKIDFSRLSYFTTLYTDSDFLNKKENESFLPQKNNPFGSVGLTAVYYALQFRKDTKIPVYFCGMDFSYSAGFTHTKGTLAYSERLLQNNRINPVENYSASFNPNSIKIRDKQNNILYSNKVMINYSNLFISFFSREQNLFDLGKTGIDLHLSKELVIYKGHENSIITKSEFSEKTISILNDYLENERNQLNYLKDILTGTIKLSENETNEEIKKIAEPREYLYLHFPDGYCYSESLSFLKRIRTEIDYFLKILND